VQISARVRNAGPVHEVELRTDAQVQGLVVAAKAAGPGSSVNGGEFLMLALATCYCNDLYREAARRGIALTAVDVQASADFDGVGLAARNVHYRASVQSPASAQEIDALLRDTDAVAEVHNTLRAGVPVTLERP
jgi:organic hydroperoxide reductase OsmC/OhrA